MRISKRGLDAIKQYEALSLKVYNDERGLPTIGYGHLLTRDELHNGKINIQGIRIKYYPGITEKAAEALFDQDLDIVENAVNRLVRVDLKQNQFDVLVSLAFNIGVSAFKDSTLLRYINARMFDGIPDQLRRWKYVGTRISNGLVNRREKEIKYWNE